MKILHVITSLSTGGAERAVYNLLQGGIANKHNCHVVSMMDEGTVGKKIKKLGVPVTSLGMKKGMPSFYSLKKLRSVVRKEQPDVIQGWMYHGNLAAWLAKKYTSKKTALVWSVRHSLYSLSEEKVLTRQVIRANRFCSACPDTILYNSHLSKTQHENFGFSSKNGLVIPNGVNTKQFMFSESDRTRLCNELSIPMDAVVIGHVARLHPMKDHALFLRASVALAKQHPKVYFVLVGRGVCVEDKSLHNQIPLEIRYRFHLLDERDDIASLMSVMDIVSSSSYSEAFPNVLGEAMSCGVPCVATNVGDSQVIISKYGIMVPPRNEEALTAGISKLVIMPEKERKKMGRSARKHIEDNFALEAIVGKYIEMYDKLAERLQSR